jgi:hypothetical protein
MDTTTGEAFRLGGGIDAVQGLGSRFGGIADIVLSPFAGLAVRDPFAGLADRIRDPFAGLTVAPLPTLRDVMASDTFSSWRIETEADRIRAEAHRARYERPSVDWQALSDWLDRETSPGPSGN